MRQRLIFFLVVLLLIFQGRILGQNKIITQVPAGILSIPKTPTVFKSKFSPRIVIGFEDCTGNKSVFRLVNIPTASCYPNSLGIICKTELKLDKITRIPIRFRLGSLDYVNWMEQKPNAIKPQ